MFEGLLGKKEEDPVTRSENFAREQASKSGALNPADDQMFAIQKERTDDLLRWQQDLDDELERLKHDLRNEAYNPETGKWEKKLIKLYNQEVGEHQFYEMPAMINELGIAQIETIIRPLLSRNLINSNLTEKRILAMLKNTTKTLIYNLGSCRDQYEIDFDNMSPVLRMVKNSIIPAPYRALNDGERKHARTMNKRVETYNESARAEEKKKGLFGFG